MDFSDLKTLQVCKISMQASEEMQIQLQAMKEYFDELVSTWKPNEHVAFVPHPSTKHYSDFTDHDEDLNQLLRARHLHNIALLETVVKSIAKCASKSEKIVKRKCGDLCNKRLGTQLTLPVQSRS
ncbi:hypothetical protein RUM43_009512 [Polyplax serrata]|uniref:Uncharacterized protein n=1 Tax=Polyplax serrata TaxID=468196 RepID=A0AAN8S4K2_POLSC